MPGAPIEIGLSLSTLSRAIPKSEEVENITLLVATKLILELARGLVDGHALLGGGNNDSI